MKRFDSILISFYYNGFLKTLSILKTLFLYKLFSKEYILFDKQKIYLRQNTSDLPVFRQVFMNNEYRFSFDIDAQDSLIVDAGANIGLFTLYISKVFPESKYICIEPDISNYRILNINLAHLQNITLLNRALWSNDSGVTLIREEELGEWGIRTNDIKNNNEEVVQSISMPSLFKCFEIRYIDILKIDIEGAESEVFSRNTEWLKCVKYIIIELHDWMSSGSSNNFFKAINNLEYFEFYISGENVIIKNKNYKTT